MIYLLPHIIAESAEHYPDHPVMRFNGASLSYAELQCRANNLAAILIDQGVKRGDRVGVYLNKSLETAVAIYGIMAAGAAYVPLDPYSPPSRLEFVIRDCGIRHLITHEIRQKSLRELLAGDSGIQCVLGIPPQEGIPVRSFTWQEIYSSDFRSPQRKLMEADLAYVMYTSGSTGKPKGLMHTHASGLSYARMAAHTYGVRHEDRLSNHSPLHFDMSTFDYFSGPLAGATTVIIPEAFTKLPASLSKLIEAERLTIWYSVPFALIQLLLRGAPQARDLSSLRWVLFGGEPFPPKHLRELMQLLPGARFSNVYGPAEVNQCTYYHLPGPPQDEQDAVPIGRIWDNAEGLVIDEQDCPLPAGEVGELVVRTPTMMRGYWAKPELNAKAFYRRQTFETYPDIFYRTGDLVQEMPDGNLRFLGRKDRQVKTHGYRVELDEIENALSAHDQVEECAAFVTPGMEGSQVIEAAAILKRDATVAGAELKAHLASLLPWYALPTRISIQEEFPRTGTGKIDRRSLQQKLVEVEHARSDPA